MNDAVDVIRRKPVKIRLQLAACLYIHLVKREMLGAIGLRQPARETLQIIRGRQHRCQPGAKPSGATGDEQASATEPGAPRSAQGGEEAPGRHGTPARVIVIGDSDFVSNAQLDSIGNRDLALASVYWLLDEERLIGIGPKPVASLRLRLTREQLLGAFWICFAGLPLLLLLLGLGVWWTRRT